MLDESPLYARSQVQVMTGLDGQTLDYWTRLGILKPVSAGSGRGHHRKYDQFQVTLARLLKEGAEFGLGGNSLATMAAEFQASIDWFSENGLTDHALHASSLITYRNDLETQGYVDVESPNQAQDGNIRIEGDDWAGLVAFHQRYCPLPDEIIAKCKSISFDEMRLHYDRFMALRPKSKGKGKATSRSIFLFKNAAGGWEIDFEEKPAKALSFITIRLADLQHELWRSS